MASRSRYRVLRLLESADVDCAAMLVPVGFHRTKIQSRQWPRSWRCTNLVGALAAPCRDRRWRFQAPGGRPAAQEFTMKQQSLSDFVSAMEAAGMLVRVTE